ncbi:hypothetical protein LTR37_002219 [Vermiconidia calcicola]|uniref:Uncharacterized protein n=1 Tax=Vermiconidia calcicola TaxID=1690605 RepID=A0ACC3NT27_9PEZI|nr:hypothetical protein LTR37_002219 [Vermiconidia calcicola]
MDDVVHKGVTPYSGVTDSKAEAQKYEDIAAIESVTSDEPEKDHANYQRMDNEIAKYAEGAAVHVNETESRRLRKMIDRRSSPGRHDNNIFYPGTLSFAAIMGIQDLPGVEKGYSWLITCIYIAVLIVEYPQNWLIQRLPIA